jgi:predicted GNAT family N-acyltransferase
VNNTREARVPATAIVRRARPADLAAAAAVLADAFADYPWTRWTVDNDSHSKRIEALQQLCMEHIALPYGEVWVACENDVVLSVAVWARPGVVVPESVRQEIFAAQAELEGARHNASIAAEARLAELRPTVAHYYLGTMGTRRDRQREGLGAAVLAPILDRADGDAAHVCLETSTAENCRFYAKFAFAEVSETQIPDGGPIVWGMLRDSC